MFDCDFVESKLSPEQRNDLDSAHDVVDVSQRNIRRGFAPMHSHVPDLDLQMERDRVDASNFRAAAGHAFNLRDDSSPDKGLKRFGREIPETCEQADKSCS